MQKLLLASTVLSAAAFQAPKAPVAPRAAPLNAVGLFYSTTTGNTETVAGYIQAAAGCAEAADVADAISPSPLVSRASLSDILRS